MKVWNGVEHYPADRGPVVASIGNYDGVHLGHQAILETVVAEAKGKGAGFKPKPANDTGLPLLGGMFSQTLGPEGEALVVELFGLKALLFQCVQAGGNIFTTGGHPEHLRPGSVDGAGLDKTVDAVFQGARQLYIKE